MAILGYGTIVQSCVAASHLLQRFGISATVVDARFCKPLDGDLIRQLAREHEVLLTVEEGSIGGFGSHVSHFLALNGLLDGTLKVCNYYHFIFFLNRKGVYPNNTLINIFNVVLIGAVEGYDATR